MDVVTNTVGVASWSLLAVAVLVVAALFVRWVWQREYTPDRVEVDFAETLAWVRSVAEVSTRTGAARQVTRHRRSWQLPDWVRTLAAHGARREPAGYGPPPPLPSELASPPPPWSVADLNTVRWPSNPVRASVPVGFADPWEEISVTRDVLAGDMRAAANTEDTGLIPVQAEVVR